ncbi:MAG: L-rhamnose isomerase [Lachnospiraceae bacterium]|nr:L-rhamnose isomerase [Lachnospiraceae bacterium]
MSYEEAKTRYAAAGVDTDAAIRRLKEVSVSLHCWQGDDVRGFDTDPDKPLTGGIQTTGNYPGRARTPEELMQDLERVITLCPGKKKLNLHASYAIFGPGEYVDRDRLEPKHFARWVEFAKKHGMGLDFNPTFFSHDKVKNGLTLASPEEETRKFWIEHGKACIRISEYFARETGIPCVMNIWIGDGLKDIPADRMGPRQRYKDAIEQILSEPHDPKQVKVTVESKVFGIGVESYTVGSGEFTLLFAATHPGVLPLMDNGHYHPTEMVSDKISSLLCYFDEIALHITRPVRWDSDHVVLLDDETREIAKEIVRNGDSLERVNIALDYFDASINRIGAWAVGFRSLQKALLNALCQPAEELKRLQDAADFSGLMARQEEMKTYPFGEVWEEYLRVCGAPSEYTWFDAVRQYEKDVLEERK